MYFVCLRVTAVSRPSRRVAITIVIFVCVVFANIALKHISIYENPNA